MSDRAQSIRDESRFGELAAGESAAQPAMVIEEEEAKGLSDSGWIFVRPDNAIEAARATRVMPDAVSDVNLVYQLDDGHVLIGSQMLTVQFDPELSREAVQTRLEENGLIVVRELRFAPNQFEVEIPHRSRPARSRKRVAAKRRHCLCGADIHRVHRSTTYARRSHLRSAVAPQ